MSAVKKYNDRVDTSSPFYNPQKKDCDAFKKELEDLMTQVEKNTSKEQVLKVKKLSIFAKEVGGLRRGYAELVELGFDRTDMMVSDPDVYLSILNRKIDKFKI